jgi:hypothetical protein
VTVSLHLPCHLQRHTSLFRGACDRLVEGGEQGREPFRQVGFGSGQGGHVGAGVQRSGEQHPPALLEQLHRQSTQHRPVLRVGVRGVQARGGRLRTDPGQLGQLVFL